MGDDRAGESRADPGRADDDRVSSLSLEEADFQVCLMARRAAWLFYFMARKMVERLGREGGERAIREAVRDYGMHCGRRVREIAQEKDLPLDLESYGRIPDLPRLGWKAESRQEGGVQTLTVSFCPMAAAWKEMGPEVERLARLYCGVDQAKYAGFDPTLTCTHAKNVLDGDPVCQLVVRGGGADR